VTTQERETGPMEWVIKAIRVLQDMKHAGCPGPDGSTAGYSIMSVDADGYDKTEVVLTKGADSDGKALRAAMTILTHAIEMASIAQSLENAQQQVAQLTAALAESGEDRQRAEAECDDNRVRFNDADRQVRDMRVANGRLMRLLQRKDEEIHELQGEREDLEGELDSLLLRMKECPGCGATEGEDHWAVCKIVQYLERRAKRQRVGTL
jgi:chromosome segregation ATPase